VTSSLRKRTENIGALFRIGNFGEKSEPCGKERKVASSMFGEKCSPQYSTILVRSHFLTPKVEWWFGICKDL